MHLEAGGFPALPEAPAEGEASAEALCARADTARPQSLSPRYRRGGLPSGGTSWPQPDAGGGATGLKPSPAILMRGTPPVTLFPAEFHSLQISPKSPMMPAL